MSIQQPDENFDKNLQHMKKRLDASLQYGIPLFPKGVKPPAPAPVCPVCKAELDDFSYGWVTKKDSEGETVWTFSEGRLKAEKIPCPACSPTALVNIAKRKRARAIDKGFRNSNIPEKFTGWTFDTYPDDADQQAKQALLDFAQDGLSGSDANCLYVWGPRGHGKTGLAVAAAHEFMAAGKSVLYMRAPEYFDRVRKQKYTKVVGGAEVDIIDLGNTAELFILDDLGVEKPTYEVAVNLYNLVEERRNNPNIYTIFTSNLSIKMLARAFHFPDLEEIDQMGYRVAERLAEDFSVVKIAGKKQRSALDTLVE